CRRHAQSPRDRSKETPLEHPMPTRKPTVGLIGTGVMGQPMATHLLAAGYPLSIYNRTKSKAEELLENGARWCESPAELARQSEIVLTILGYPSDVESVYLGESGIINAAQKGALLIDLTTSCPDLAKRIAEAAAAKKLAALDAPVSGGDRGAREAALSIMV